jgi:hypothetical protein
MVVVSAAAMLDNGVFGDNEEKLLLNILDWLATCWRLHVDIADGYPATLTLAQRVDAAAGMDSHDVSAGSAPADKAVAWLETAAGTPLHGDYRPSAASAAWTLQVDARMAATACVLSWNASMLPPERLYAYEVDADGRGIPGGDEFFMDEKTMLVVDAGTRRRFHLVSGLNTFDLRLKPGWNLISVPLLPVDNNPAAVLRNPRPGPVWSWQQGRFAAAEMMEPLQGYWVYCGDSEPDGMKIVGLSLRDTWREFPAGWNLVGTGGLPSGGNLKTPLRTIPEDAGGGQAWNCRVGSYQPVAELESGIGYWIYLHTRAKVNLGTE